MQIAPYLSFDGQCQAAFNLYAQVFRGRVGEVFRYEGSPMADQVPPDWGKRVMHGSVKIGDITLMGADAMPGQFETAKGISMSIHLDDVAEAERVYRELSKGGTIIMPLEKTFWAERFGVFIDRFGTPWSINGGNPEPPPGD